MSPEKKYSPEFEPHQPKLLFLAHTDYVHKKGMKWEVKDGYVTGVLDDMLPAALLMSMQGLLKGKAIFTTDEESKMHDAEKIAKRIYREYPPPKGRHRFMPDRTWLPIVCVLEVTNLKTDADVAFEGSSFFDMGRIRKAMSHWDVKDVKYIIHGAGSWDETWRFAEAKLPSFGMSIPVEGKYHTYNAKARIDRIRKFKRALYAVDREFSR